MTPPTEKEIALLLRAAFMTGWRSEAQRIVGGEAGAIREAARLYPLPKITRPRVVTEASGTSWRLIGDEYQDKKGFDNWRRSISATWTPTVERVRLWADLLANPAEEVEDDS